MNFLMKMEVEYMKVNSMSNILRHKNLTKVIIVKRGIEIRNGWNKPKIENI